MTRRVRVLHLITTFPQSSGAAENTKLSVNLLDRERFETFLATQPGQSMETELAPHVKQVPLRWLRRRINPALDAAAAFEIWRTLRSHQFDIVHTHNAKDGILGRWVAFLARVPAIVHTIHNVSFEASDIAVLRWLFALQERWAALITDRILVVSTQNSEKCLATGIGRREQYLTVYSGLDLTRYKPDGRAAEELRLDLKLPNHPGPWVAWIGRFNRQKDPETFLRAARLVKNVIAGAQFILCGDDPLGLGITPDPRRLVCDLGLQGAVHFLGFRRDIPTVLRAVDIVMHSSRYEGMGRVVCEALACDRPVAGTAVDGVVEVIVSGERGGILAPPRNPERLAAAAVQLLREPHLGKRLAAAGRRWVEENLSAQKMVRTLEQVYEELLPSR